jgi:hypothetical protein
MKTTSAIWYTDDPERTDLIDDPWRKKTYSDSLNTVKAAAETSSVMVPSQSHSDEFSIWFTSFSNIRRLVVLCCFFCPLCQPAWNPEFARQWESVHYISSINQDISTNQTVKLKKQKACENNRRLGTILLPLLNECIPNPLDGHHWYPRLLESLRRWHVCTRNAVNFVLFT